MSATYTVGTPALPQRVHIGCSSSLQPNRELGICGGVCHEQRVEWWIRLAFHQHETPACSVDIKRPTIDEINDVHVVLGDYTRIQLFDILKLSVDDERHIAKVLRQELGIAKLFNSQLIELGMHRI